MKQFNDKLEIRMTPDKGYGVFAIDKIEKDELLLENVVLILPKCTSKTTRCAVERYEYIWEFEEDGDTEKSVCIVLGAISIINHNENNNVGIMRDYNKRTIKCFAIKEIRAGEELEFDYGYTVTE